MTPLLLHTQLGFRNALGRKTLVVPDVPEAYGLFGDPIFWVMEQNEFSKHALNSDRQHLYTYRASLQRRDTDFGRWLVGDLASLRTDGVYQAFLGSHLGPTFVIRDDVYRRILPFCLMYFRVQSCGRDVPGWHPACHLDDGYLLEEDRHIPAAGGWHDAGDFRKWASSTALIAISLLLGHRLWSGRETELGVAPGVFLAEALQGFDYFLNLQQADGSLLHNVGGGRRSVHDNEDCRYTDNVPCSGDERRVHPGAAKPAAKYALLYALYAEQLRATDPARADQALAAARRALVYDLTLADASTDAVQWRAWACLVLYRATGEADDREAAVTWARRLLELQVTEFIGGQSLTRGFWRAHPVQPGYHRKHVGADYPVWVLGEFAETLPDHPDAARWREAIRLWADDYVGVFSARNPFGLLPYGLYEEPPTAHPRHRYRPLGDRLCFRYFMANEGRISNARCSLSAAALAAAARALDRPELLDLAYPLLEWTLGANPFGLSFMSGVGVAQPDALSFQMGNIPGGVTLGPGGDEQDLPCYRHPRSCTDEYYGYQTSQFMWALLALETVRPRAGGTTAEPGR